jgi:O-antigen ligase
VFSTQYRTEAWRAATRAWAIRPVLGYGPGQSAVRLAGETDVDSRANPTEPPAVLGSAQGLWAAALVDAGVVGLGAWLVLLGAAIATASVAVIRRPTVLGAALLAASVTAVLGAMVTGDRFELRAWVVIALLLAGTLGGAARRGDGDSDGRERGAEAR